MIDLIIGGNILEAAAEAIVIPVNCKGVMGAGLARAAASKWPYRQGDYFKLCRGKHLRPGGVVADDRVGKTPRVLFYVATKDDWKNPSQMEWVVLGASRLAKAIPAYKLASLAIPALGCGLGGLDWHEVEIKLMRAFANTDAKVILYAPQGVK